MSEGTQLVLCISLGSITTSLFICAWHLSRISKAVSGGVLQMKDVDRAKVYSEHLGEKLRK